MGSPVRCIVVDTRRPPPHSTHSLTHSLLHFFSLSLSLSLSLSAPTPAQISSVPPLLTSSLLLSLAHWATV
eukprot:602366-Rhodomonas_salina.1